jgi:hypothetical protein
VAFLTVANVFFAGFYAVVGLLATGVLAQK